MLTPDINIDAGVICMSDIIDSDAMIDTIVSGFAQNFSKAVTEAPRTKTLATPNQPIFVFIISFRILRIFLSSDLHDLLEDRQHQESGLLESGKALAAGDSRNRRLAPCRSRRKLNMQKIRLRST